MKVKQVVGEHKKGFRAKKYASKPKKYIEPVKPTSTATKPQGVAEGDDPLQNRADYAKKHGQGQVYKKTYPGDKVGMTKAYAYDVKRTGPKGQLPKEDMDLDETTPSGVVSAVSPDVKQVTIKKSDGTELKTTGDAVLPGPDGKTASLAPGAGNELKPGTPVTSGQSQSVSEAPGEDMPPIKADQLMNRISQEDPNATAYAKKLIVAKPDGTVDFKQTFRSMSGEFITMFPDIIDFFTEIQKMAADAITTPEFKTFTPEQQAGIVELSQMGPKIKEMWDMVHGMAKQHDDQWNKDAVDSGQYTTHIESRSSRPDKSSTELAEMLRIAGLR